jgi:glycosyltransferase involved in cell wall biosynthesis
MRIAIYVPSWPPGQNPNGIVTYASHIIPAFRALGHEVLILTFNHNSFGNSDIIDLNRFQKSGNFIGRNLAKLSPDLSAFRAASYSIASAVKQLVITRRIDIFEIEESFGWSAKTSDLQLVPVVVRLHGPTFLNQQFNRHKLSTKINREKEGLKKATYVTSCSNDVLAAVKSYYKMPFHNSAVIYNPIDVADVTSIWREDRCNHDSLLYVGRFDKIKGGDVVVRAFAILADEFPHLTLSFVGPDLGVDNVSFDQFVQRHIPEEARARIVFHGRLPHAEVMRLRGRHFITIVGSRYEPQGYTVMEAMSRGCPLVSTAVGGIKEIVSHGETGLLVPASDPEALAESCRTLLGNNDLAAHLGNNAREECVANYNPTMIAKGNIAAYGRAIDIFKTQSGSL